MTSRRRVFGAVLVAALVFAPAPAQALEKLRVLVPDRDNLQYMAFWVARAGGFFEKEGLDVDIVVPPGPQQTAAFFEKREAEIAVLPPPVFLQLIGDKQPVVLVANLLRNDPIDLIVHADVARERKITTAMPLRDRLAALKGLKLGIAPHPPTRLRALFASVGLDADHDVQMVILHGKEQNAAFAKHEVDALYAHTPYLEKAIVQDNAQILVEQTAGEAPELSNRQIHGLVFTRRLVDERATLVEAAVRAIAAAEKSIHASQPTTVETLARAYPNRDRRELETIVRLYEKAIPESPAVDVKEVPRGLMLFPAGNAKPDLTGIDLNAHVAPSFALEAAAPPRTNRAWWIVGIVVAVLALGGFVALGRRRPA
jgi:NitT/TauT family transport system substrate-binding protein